MSPIFAYRDATCKHLPRSRLFTPTQVVDEEKDARLSTDLLVLSAEMTRTVLFWMKTMISVGSEDQCHYAPSFDYEVHLDLSFIDESMPFTTVLGHNGCQNASLQVTDAHTCDPSFNSHAKIAVFVDSASRSAAIQGANVRYVRAIEASLSWQ